MKYRDVFLSTISISTALILGFSPTWAQAEGGTKSTESYSQSESQWHPEKQAQTDKQQQTREQGSLGDTTTEPRTGSLEGGAETEMHSGSMAESAESEPDESQSGSLAGGAGSEIQSQGSASAQGSLKTEQQSRTFEGSVQGGTESGAMAGRVQSGIESQSGVIARGDTPMHGSPPGEGEPSTTWQMHSQRYEMGAGTLKKDDVKKAQQALKQKGHNPGPVDGIIGPKTQAALRDFQQTQGLSATGTLDTATKQALGIENSAAQSKAQQ